MSIDFGRVITAAIEWAVPLVLAYVAGKGTSAVAQWRRTASLPQDVTNLSRKIDKLVSAVDTSDRERREHDRVSDGASVYTMRDHLLRDYDALVTKGFATYDERRRWHDAYQLYERLVDSSGQVNGVMGDYQEGIDELPTDRPAA